MLYDVIDFTPTQMTLKNEKVDMRSPSNFNKTNVKKNSSNISTNKTIPQKVQSVNNYNMQHGGNNSTLKIYRK